MLEGHDGVVWKDHVRNCAPCHLSNVDGTVDPSLAVVRAGLKCMLCGSKGELWYTNICVCFRPCYVFVCVCEYGMSTMYVV